MTHRTIRLDVALDDDDDLTLLRGALLAAKATELGEAHRRGARLSFGYGSDSAREDMNAEIAQSRRRADLLDRLVKALPRAEEATER
jgi:hypothetical protein